VLMWTRWGKTRVTHKCLVLSILAHILLFTWVSTEKIIGAPGSAGREGAPGIVGDHPTVLVANVQLEEGASDQPDRVREAVNPWKAPPLGAAAPPASAGPERTRVDLATAPQRTLSRPDPMNPDEHRNDAQPLSPRVPHASSNGVQLPADD